jgi:phosphate:Na+ symporter
MNLKHCLKNSGAIVFFLLLIYAAAPAYAAADDREAISWFFLLVGLAGGLAFFLYGMAKMSEGMKRSAGNKMRAILAALTQHRIIGLIAGAFVTCVIQSSSATTVMLVSFVQAGLMSFVNSLAVILGADIGTTITAQLIAFKLTDYALMMIAIGFGLQMFSKNENTRNVGNVILGFGILFFGMKLMSDAMAPLRTYPAFFRVLEGLENPLLGILAGAVFTAVVQSSSAFTGVVIVLAQQGLITLEAGIPMIFGANIGTCVTAGIATIGMSRDAKRVAVAHVIFKIGGVLLFIFWIPQFADFIRMIAGYFGSGTARQVANAHTIFNVTLALLFLPFTGHFGKIVLKLLPDQPQELELKPAVAYLDNTMITTPVLAINLARAEISRMAKLLERMLRAIIVPFISDPNLIRRERSLPPDEKKLLLKEVPSKDAFFPQLSLIEGLEMREEKIDYLQKKVKDYLIAISRKNLTSEQADEIYGMMSIVKDMESIGDIVHRNMLPLAAKKQAVEIDFSEEGKEELMIYHEKVCRQIKLLKEAFAQNNLDKAHQIMNSERIYLDLESQYRVRHLERLLSQKSETVKTHEIHLELMDLMKQIIVYSSNIAVVFTKSCSKPEAQ